MAKRIYSESVKKWLIGAGITAGTLITGIFIYLQFIGAITVDGYSGDSICAGTLEDPCYAYINFTANEDIFIYPTDYDPWGRNTIMEFDPAVSSWKLQRSWGSGWRDIPLDKPCTGTWCGLSNSKDERKFSIAFRKGKSYQIRIIAYKKSSLDTIKWGAFDGEIDPIWGPTYFECLVKTGDNIISKQDKSLWTEDMNITDRSSSFKQGYIINCRPNTWNNGNWSWGKLEHDPKRFAIIRIPVDEYNESWFEPEFDYTKPITDINSTCMEECLKKESKDCDSQCEFETGEFEVLTKRKYNLPLESFLTPTEIDDIKNIRYNKEVNWTIQKEVLNISRKIEQVDYESRPEEFRVHGSSGTFTICPSGCNYSSFLNWVAGEAGDIRGTGPCIGNVTEGFTDTSVGDNELDGWTTSPDDYVRFTVAEGAMHNGVLNYSKYMLVGNYEFGSAIQILSDNVIVDGVQLVANYTGRASYFPGGTAGIHGVNVTVYNCLMTNLFGNGIGINYDAGDTGGYYIAYNNIIYNELDGINNNFGVGSRNISIYSNTIINTTSDGIEMIDQSADISLYLKNNICFDNIDDYDLTAFTDRSYTNNAGEDDDSLSQTNYYLITTAGTDLFLDYTNYDYHLSSTSELINQGTDLSTDPDGKQSFDFDIDLETRSGTWDIGADEYVSGIDSSPPTYSLNQTNSTANGSAIMHSLYWQDDTNLDGYIFSYCNATYNISGNKCELVAGNTSNVLLQKNVTENLGDVGIFYANPTGNLGAGNLMTLHVVSPLIYNDLIKFRIKDKIPIGANIVDSKLHLYNNLNALDDVAEGFLVEVHEVYQSYYWDEYTVTWNTGPGSGDYNETFEDYVNFTGAMAENVWINWSVIGMVTDAVNKGYDNLSILLNGTGTFGSPTSTDWLQFRTSQYYTNITLQPILNITYTMPSTGGFVNDTFVALIGTGNWSNITKISQPTAGLNYSWCVYANDSSGNWNGTSCVNPFYYTTAESALSSINYNISSCTSINSSGDYYLSLNLESNFTCINISVSDVRLDCRDYSINYSMETNNSFGISILGNNTLVKNCHLYHQENDIFTRNNYAVSNRGYPSTKVQFNITIYNNTINVSGEGNYSPAIWFNNLSNSNISSNIIDTDGLDEYGFNCYADCNNITIHDNAIITRDNYQDSNAIYFSLDSSNIKIYNNNFTTYSQFGDGIKSWHIVNDRYYDNRIYTHGTTADGILTQNATNLLIHDNYIKTVGGNSRGIRFIHVNNSFIINNTIYTNSTINEDIHIEKSSNNLIENNLINGSDYGVAIVPGTNNTIRNNTIVSNDYAVHIDGGFNNKAEYNIINSTKGFRVRSFYTDTSLFIYNNTVIITDDTQYFLTTNQFSFNVSEIRAVDNIVNANRLFSIDQGNTNTSFAYNNLFNYSIFGTGPGFLNTTSGSGNRIIGTGSTGGNAYINRSGGYSYYYSCTDLDYDGLCDSPFDTVTQGPCTAGVDCGIYTDYLPLSDEFGAECRFPNDYGVNKIIQMSWGCNVTGESWCGHLQLNGTAGTFNITPTGILNVTTISGHNGTVWVGGTRNIGVS